MLSAISEKVKTGNVSIVNDLSRYRKNLLIFVMYIYLFQPELLNFDWSILTYLERLKKEC